MENQTIKHLSDFNEMLYQRLQDVEHRLERLKIICSSLGSNDFSLITSQIANLQTEITSLKQSLKTNTTTLSNLTTATENNATNISTLSNSVTSNTSNIKNLQNITNTHTNRLDTHDTQLAAIDINTITQNLEKISSLEQQVNTNKTNIQTLNSNTADISSIRDRSLSNEIDIVDLNSRFKNYQTEQESKYSVGFGRVDLRLNNLEESSDDYGVRINVLEQNNSTNTLNITNNSQQIEELKTQLNNSKIENELSFILNGTYILQSDIDNIINGTYSI